MSKEEAIAETSTKEVEEKVEKTREESKKTLTPEQKQARKKKVIRTSIIISIIIGLTIGAAFVGPANMEPGQYQVKLSINLGQQSEDVYFNITMAESANTATTEHYKTIGSSGNSTVIITNQAYKSSTHSKIEFRVGLVDSTNSSITNLALTQISGNINGEGMDRKIRPIKIQTVYSSTVDDDITVAYFSMMVPFKAGIAMALLVLVAGLWITEILPTIVGAFLVPIMIVISGISTSGEALQPFFDPVIALFFGGFIIAEALKKHNIDRRLALGIVSRASIRPSILLIILMSVSAFLSMWMSNTASAAVMVPLAIALVTQIEEGGKEKDTTGFKKALVLGIGYAATTGGIASIIGTPANPIAVEGLADLGPEFEISFLKWFAYGLPFVFIMIFVIWGYLMVIFKPKISKESLADAQIVFKDDLKKMGKMKTKEWITVIIFLVTIALWLLASPLEKWTGGLLRLSSGIIALIAVVLIFATNTLKPKDVKTINWNALFLFGGGLALGEALEATGIGD